MENLLPAKVPEVALDQTDLRILDQLQRDASLTNDALASRVHVSDMEAYHALAHRLFGGEANVRNVRTFFSVRRAKFSPTIALPAA